MTALLAPIGSVPADITTATAVNPVASAIQELTDPAKACGTDPSWACTWIYDLTGSDTWAGVADWVLAKPLTILGIVLVAWIVSRLARWIISRSVERFTGAPHRERMNRLRERTPNVLLKSDQWDLRRDARTHTMVAVGRSIVTVAIWFVALVAILDTIGINFGPLIAGAGIIGIALGFGTQTMVRDFIAGFFIVAEDQLGVGDVVDLGPDARGTVERMTLRSTRVRDANGVVWHVPNGQIQRVGNKSQEWARAVLDVVVGYDADLDQVREIVSAVAEDLSADPAWADDVLEAPDLWGVEDMTAEGITVRLVIKTRPAAQFALQRALRERLKQAFDEAGVTFAAAGGPTTVILSDGGPSTSAEPSSDESSAGEERGT